MSAVSLGDGGSEMCLCSTFLFFFCLFFFPTSRRPRRHNGRRALANAAALFLAKRRQAALVCFCRVKLNNVKCTFFVSPLQRRLSTRPSPPPPTPPQHTLVACGVRVNLCLHMCLHARSHMSLQTNTNAAAPCLFVPCRISVSVCPAPPSSSTAGQTLKLPERPRPR